MVITQKCNFLLECYSYKLLGKMNGRASYILQRYCIDHCILQNCPHRDEATVELYRIILLPDDSQVLNNGGNQQVIDIWQQSPAAQQLESGETLIPYGKGYPRMVPRVPKMNRDGPNRILATK
jgi:hypothetical protein